MTQDEHNLLVENNRMLKYIVFFINQYKNNFDNENQNDFIRNIIANIIGDKIIQK